MTVPNRSRKIDDYREVLDGSLRGDLTAPRKQRHTAKRIFDRLCAEHHADVSYSRVRAYVSVTPPGKTAPITPTATTSACSSTRSASPPTLYAQAANNPQLTPKFTIKPAPGAASLTPVPAIKIICVHGMD